LMTYHSWRHNQGRALTYNRISQTQTVRGNTEPNLLLQN
jgi:hypothetical protein